ncbi:hypothetical protein C0992_007631 [Termitomyces sp. T32_za158]|nr:hypothetical protein C0992_007631 [Termitomyces sp. T32_za158]
MSATLKAISSASIEEQSRVVTAQILSLPAFQQAQSVSCYLSMPSGELDTSFLVSEILKSGNGSDYVLGWETLISIGKTLFVPRIDPSKDSQMDFVRVYGKEDLNTFPIGTWGIKEPGSQWRGSLRESALVGKNTGLDIILVPGVAFDRSFSRLGHGKGYYDHFLGSYSSIKKSKPLLGKSLFTSFWCQLYITYFPVALALREQVLEEGEVPTGPHDWSMDLIVTPELILSKGQGRNESWLQSPLCSG